MEEVLKHTNTHCQTILRNALNTFFNRRYCFSMWRLPDSRTSHLIATKNPLKLGEVDIEKSSSGFIFAPFQQDKEKMFLPADEVISFQNEKILSFKGALMEEIISNPFTPKTSTKSLNYYEGKMSSGCYSISQKGFLELIKKCQNEISKQSFEKIVATRTQYIALTHPFDIATKFAQMCEFYPHALVYVLSSSETGTWLGASPELLVSNDKDGHFRTEALAATQPYREGVNLQTATWGQKEIEEQALVVRYIINCFKKIRLREFEEKGPKSVGAGNVIHLKTSFEVDTVATNFPNLGTVMLKLLHPTSAVCGMPKEESLRFLLQNEKYDRQYFTGYLGPINFESESHLFVNLRCMQLFKNNVMLYAGTGITDESVPELEWKETEWKMDTMLRILNS